MNSSMPDGILYDEAAKLVLGHAINDSEIYAGLSMECRQLLTAEIKHRLKQCDEDYIADLHTTLREGALPENEVTQELVAGARQYIRHSKEVSHCVKYSAKQAHEKSGVRAARVHHEKAASANERLLEEYLPEVGFAALRAENPDQYAQHLEKVARTIETGRPDIQAMGELGLTQAQMQDLCWNARQNRPKPGLQQSHGADYGRIARTIEANLSRKPQTHREKLATPPADGPATPLPY